MKKIDAVFGILYIEEENDVREEGRIKLYDSEMRYFDYYSLDNLGEGETVAGLVDENVKMIVSCKSLDEMLERLGINYYSASTDWTELLEDLYDGDARSIDGEWVNISDNSIITEQTIMENEFVNKIGDTYILVSE